MSEIISTLVGVENKEFFEDYAPVELWRHCQEDGWFFYGAIVGDTACGVIVAELQGITMVIQSLYVAPGYRNMGVATELLMTLQEEAKRYSCPAIRMRFMEDLEQEPGIQHLIQMFTSEISRTGNAQYEFDGTQVCWEKMHLKKEKTEGCMVLAECDKRLAEQVKQCVERSSRCYVPLPFRMENYDKRHSVIYYKHHKLQGIMLMHQAKDGVYVLDYMGNFGEEPDVFLKLLNCATASFQGTETECRYRVACINEKVGSLMKKLIQIESRYELEARIPIM